MFVKICGITSEEDALLAVACGADAVGFIFAPSRRQISPVTAGDIVKRLPTDVLTVGVFRDESPKRVVETVQAAGLRAAQLSGHEAPEDTAWVRERIPFVIKGFAAGGAGVAEAARHRADVILLDNAEPGSGRLFDWRLASDVPKNARLLLAGGLTPDNVAEAVVHVRPWGVDVATGVESTPGRKDARKVRAFVAAAKAAAPPDDGDAGAAGSPYDWQADG
ncbi:MAG TPA: phosphoribosylanthranilate isomerase [Acidimicrobiales bacterium]|nr:phosphoribosylanthranilate isomerase [Acidimicrobiales bacterium]